MKGDAKRFNSLRNALLQVRGGFWANTPAKGHLITGNKETRKGSNLGKIMKKKIIAELKRHLERLSRMGICKLECMGQIPAATCELRMAFCFWPCLRLNSGPLELHRQPDFCTFQWLRKKEANNISWHMKIISNSNFSVCKVLMEYSQSHSFT